ncbi:TonB-dependent receptor [Parabacteroides faecis]|uniref:TonB-dependent receptor n=1 Tax=Parabacteroides faecis TaxID=1217282 RepID=UPI0021644D45|nr:TonB-dependent receptor [Parabacteroides faecis]MCS2891927.1 TonB-dependent receptor [Parabacteroides faecis]UVQ44469.1 TonB-dependent receptor [Parabacteroides faecis]
MQKHFNTQQFWVPESFWFTLNKIPRVMKLYIFLLFCSISLVQATNSYAQKTTVNLKIQNQTVLTVLDEIENQSEFSFFFNIRHVDLNRKVSVVAKKSDIFKVLDNIFAGTNVQYSVVDKKIILSSKSQTVPQSNRKRTVTGVISDQNGEPVIGVNVLEKGTTNGTITDVDGKYSIVVADNAILLISYIGYQNYELPVKNQSVIDVQLKEDTQALDEVVVIGYGTAKKKDLTGAISRVKADKMEVEAPRTVEDILRGNASGLSIGMATGASGTSDFQIRGKNTLSAGSSPLIVLDGVIYDGSMQDINPIDIESVDVLKDASSVAVYGAKAANGVIAITTKKGSSEKPVVTFNANVGTVHAARVARAVDGAGFLKFRQEYGEGLLSPEEMAAQPGKFADPRTLNGMGIDALAWYNYDQQNPVATLPDEKALLTTWLTRLNMKNIEIEHYLNGVETDWNDVVYQTGLQQDYTASVSNRLKNTSYYWSIGYADREGVVVGDRYRNFRTRLNLESKITSFLTVGVNAQFATRIGGYLKADVSVREWNSPYTTNDIDDPNSPYRQYPSGDNNTVNPFFDNLYIDRRDINHDLNTNLYAIVKLPLGFEYQMNFIPRYHWYEYMNHESAEHPNWKGDGGRAERKHEKTFNWQLDHIVRWKQEFGKDHRLEGTFLFNAEKGQFWQTVVKNRQFSPNDKLGYHNIGSGTVPEVSSNDTYKTGDALMGRLFYSFKDRYMLTASVRRDGYSAFGQMNPRAVFPAVALGWVFSSEKFMEPTKNWLNYAKLRLSWGENGNRDIGQYDALSSLSTGLYPYTELNGTILTSALIYVNRMANKDLKWERTASYNIGLDFSVLNDRLSGSMEGYIAQTNDLLVDRSLPSILGFSSVKANLGELANRGFELSLNGRIIENENFVWESGGTFFFNRRKINHLYGDMEEVKDAAGNVIGYKEADDIKNKWFIGHDPDQIWDYERDGVWQMDESDEAAIYGNKPGDFKYIDKNGDGVMNNDDKVFQGYKTPRFRWSWRNEFSFYKDISLSFMLYSHVGQYGTFNQAANDGRMMERQTVLDLPRWTVDNPTDEYGKLGSKNIGNNYKKQTFVRMENITLSYNVPQQFLKKISVQNMRFSLAVRNPFVLTKWSFGDPEGGITTIRSFNLGVNFSL